MMWVYVTVMHMRWVHSLRGVNAPTDEKNQNCLEVTTEHDCSSLIFEWESILTILFFNLLTNSTEVVWSSKSFRHFFLNLVLTCQCIFPHDAYMLNNRLMSDSVRVKVSVASLLNRDVNTRYSLKQALCRESSLMTHIVFSQLLYEAECGTGAGVIKHIHISPNTTLKTVRQS